MPGFIIKVHGEDRSDLDFLREHCLAAVEEVVEENKDRMDAEVGVEWEWVDDE